MKVFSTSIRAVKRIEKDHLNDRSVSWCERIYSYSSFERVGLNVFFTQEMRTKINFANTVRGLYYQRMPYCQNILARCDRGAVYQYAVDLHRSSPTFGKYVCLELSEDNGRQMFIPSGFAHGLISITDDAVVNYKADRACHSDFLRIDFFDPKIGIKCPDNEIEPIVSALDSNAISLNEAIEESLL